MMPGKHRRYQVAGSDLLQKDVALKPSRPSGSNPSPTLRHLLRHPGALVALLL